jgi:hypothetical protein
MDTSTISGNAFGAVLFLMFTVMPFVFMLLIGFWIWMLVDCVTKESSQGNDKLVWVLILVLTNWIGALIYFFVRRPQRLKSMPPELPRL